MGRERGREIHRRNYGGYAAEIAAARCLGHREWMPVWLPRFSKTADLPGGIEVRHAEPQDYNLLIYGRDPEDAPVILVTGDPDRELELRGWILAGRGRRVGTYRADMKRDAKDPDTCFLVARGFLDPMEVLSWRR